MSPLEFFLITLGCSILAGGLGALLGLGGGIIIIPVLTLGLGVDIHYAIGASIVSVIATSSGAAATYVRDRITNLDLLPDLISRSPQLWSTLRNAIETDLTLGQMVDLAVLASRVPADRIVTAGVDQSYTRFWTTPGGADVLILDAGATETLITDLFAPPSAAAVTQ